jgi:hypothetical protein
MRKIEDILYGSDVSPSRLPSVHELFFIFTEYEPTIFDAGNLSEEYFAEFDAGSPPDTVQTSTMDGGGP